jgi:putative two-component system response regulator
MNALKRNTGRRASSSSGVSGQADEGLPRVQSMEPVSAVLDPFDAGDPERSQEETIRRLAVVAESRDDSTVLHIERMSRYSAVLAAKLGMAPGQCEEIRLATQMHDVGKVGLPDSILSNPALLTAAEREVAEEHCAIGFGILSGSGSALLDLGAQVALTHHERVDGTGYPHGLRGAEIPVAGRIAAIADVFDALTTDKPYRKAWSVEDAVEFMRSERGTHFNHELLDRFFESLPEILGVKEQYAEKSR